MLRECQGFGGSQPTQEPVVEGEDEGDAVIIANRPQGCNSCTRPSFTQNRWETNGFSGQIVTTRSEPAACQEHQPWIHLEVAEFTQRQLLGATTAVIGQEDCSSVWIIGVGHAVGTDVQCQQVRPKCLFQVIFGGVHRCMRPSVVMLRECLGFSLGSTEWTETRSCRCSAGKWVGHHRQFSELRTWLVEGEVVELCRDPKRGCSPLFASERCSDRETAQHPRGNESEMPEAFEL